MDLGANPHGHLSDLNGLCEANSHRNREDVATILFPVCDDVGGSTDGGGFVQAIEDEVLQVRQVDVAAVAVTRDIPERLIPLAPGPQ